MMLTSAAATEMDNGPIEKYRSIVILPLQKNRSYFIKNKVLQKKQRNSIPTQLYYISLYYVVITTSLGLHSNKEGFIWTHGCTGVDIW